MPKYKFSVEVIRDYEGEIDAKNEDEATRLVKEKIRSEGFYITTKDTMYIERIDGEE